MEINKIFGKVGQERGRESEALLDEALNRAIDAEAVPEWLVGYSPGTKKDDKNGIDGWVETSDVGKIWLQVKSSRKAAEQSREKHPKIPVVIIRLGDSEKKIVNTVIGEIGGLRKIYLEKRQK